MKGGIKFWPCEACYFTVPHTHTHTHIYTYTYTEANTQKLYEPAISPAVQRYL